MQESGKGMRKVGDAGLTRRNFLFGAALAGAGVAAAGMAGCAGEPSGGSGGASSDSAGGSGGATQSGDGMNADAYFGKWAFEIPDAAITDIAETIEADVVVVGAGTGGLTVANAVAEDGGNVVLISASSKPISRGGSNHATYSKAMEALNIPRNDALFTKKSCRPTARAWTRACGTSTSTTPRPS